MTKRYTYNLFLQHGGEHFRHFIDSTFAKNKNEAKRNFLKKHGKNFLKNIGSAGDKIVIERRM